ncbi:mechanosensitive ion channel family protein [Anaerosacchariphilus polymeriproducens]|uniref:Mechanosensitive ion channel family protein n=1 Tax=Anaerosacchariphilus polymeriproducens TaxID=1812858 RepID=A0A371AUP9_9FIRM|nr:mechanosensitive ion channel domain-containing protein [Anaerosacchariphilus polymeriproducens]RDU23288.1 mechanosensitive ion channel family protein [Anaerosacchariphilus polymeriproducens]
MFLETVQKVLDFINNKRFLQAVTDFALQIVIAIIIYIIGIKLIKFTRNILRKSLLRTNVEQGVIQFLDSLLKILLYILLILIIGGRFGVTKSSVIALLGSVGLAIGLSLQGSLSNFAGGVLILILKPFKVGDYIMEDTNKNEGTVKEIQIFYTKLLTPDNKIIVIPNGVLSNSSLTNATNQDKRRVSVSVGISYDSDLKKAKNIIEKLLVQDEKVLLEEPIEVFVDQLTQSAVIITGRMWVLTDDYWPAKWRITEEMKLAFDKEDIKIPHNLLDIKVNK